MEKEKKNSILKTRSERFAFVMATLQEIFCPEKPVSSRKVKIYEKLLEPFSIEAIERAAEDIAYSKRIHAFPLPVDFIDAIQVSECKLEEEGLKLWNTACMLAFTSNYPSEDDLLNRTIELAFGSWRKFGETKPDNDWDRTHFIRCYKIVMKGRPEKFLEQGKDKMLKGGNKND